MIRSIFRPVLAVFTFVLFLIVFLVFLTPFHRGFEQNVTVKISKGDTFRYISRLFEKEGIVFNEYVFLLTGKLLGYDKKLVPGEYTFGNDETIWHVLQTITDPEHPVDINVTIPEGYNIRQIGRILSKRHGMDSAKFVNAAFNDSLIKVLGENVSSLEGFLYPETYRLSFSSAGIEAKLVNVMFSEFMRKITPAVRDSIRLAERNLKDVVTMASIIQGETRFVPEMRTIAGVYYNRLRKKMKLEADPTVQYSLPETKKRLKYEDLKFPSLYNTYLHPGLPPGPIGNPSIDAIMAAINPERNNYLYFVAKGDGSHKFAETFEQHKKNVADYRKLMEKQKSQ